MQIELVIRNLLWQAYFKEYGVGRADGNTVIMLPTHTHLVCVSSHTKQHDNNNSNNNNNSTMPATYFCDDV
jgi:hypothetical protein